LLLQYQLDVCVLQTTLLDFSQGLVVLLVDRVDQLGLLLSNAPEVSDQVKEPSLRDQPRSYSSILRSQPSKTLTVVGPDIGFVLLSGHAGRP